jgi:hypothetical protein
VIAHFGSGFDSAVDPDIVSALDALVDFVGSGAYVESFEDLGHSLGCYTIVVRLARSDMEDSPGCTLNLNARADIETPVGNPDAGSQLAVGTELAGERYAGEAAAAVAVDIVADETAAAVAAAVAVGDLQRSGLDC